MGLNIRIWMSRVKNVLTFQYPYGLGSLGRDSTVRRPRTIWGRERIHIGAKTIVLSHSLLHALSRYGNLSLDASIRVGNEVYIGRYSYIVAANRIEIGDGCVLSEHVYITDLNHGFNPRAGNIMTQPIESKGPVHIGPNCFLGYRVAVMPGVTLGEWCIVGANSVVTKSFPAYSMIAGAPARLVKVYSHELGQWLAPPHVLT